MADRIRISVDGIDLLVDPDITVAAAIALSGRTWIRRSVSGEPRGALCGMGICFECRATVDGVPQEKTCQLPVRAGMEVRTDA
jgi:sarcosine oxidase subunit alpha